MRPRIYVDTSVFGGCEDVEFIGHSRRLVAAMTNGDYAMVISEVTLLELEKAPAAVRAHLERIPESLVEVLALDSEAEELAAQYIRDGAVGKNERADALHTALATAARVDVLVSWNFKHIVNLRRIHAFNADSKVTGSFEVAVKYRNTFTIPDADAPKVAITSNYAIAGDDPSTQRRNFQIEVSDHYKHQLEEYGLRPADLHGGKLIARKEGGWNANDWNHYYSVICDCISLYLKKGLPAQSEESITFKRSKLCAEMPVENKDELLDYLLSCLNDAAASGEEQIAEVYYKKTRDKFVFSDEVSDRNLWELLKKVGKAFRLIPNNAQKGRLQDQRLTGERKQRWLDAGMEDYRDQNGNNPLDDSDRKVHVFTVSSFQKTQDILKESKPDFNNGKW